MDLPERLFWDIDSSSLDVRRHARFIIERVVTRGTLDDWIELKKMYELSTIKTEILKIKSLDKKTHHFFSAYFGIEKENFRCFNTRQSNPVPFNS